MHLLPCALHHGHPLPQTGYPLKPAQQVRLVQFQTPTSTTFSDHRNRDKENVHLAMIYLCAILICVISLFVEHGKAHCCKVTQHLWQWPVTMQGNKLKWCMWWNFLNCTEDTFTFTISDTRSLPWLQLYMLTWSWMGQVNLIFSPNHRICLLTETQKYDTKEFKLKGVPTHGAVDDHCSSHLCHHHHRHFHIQVKLL